MERVPSAETRRAFNGARCIDVPSGLRLTKKEAKMKGIIFDLLEQVVEAQYGQDTWDQLLATSGLDGAYTAVGSYPDEELFALVDSATKALSIERDDLLRWFGASAIPLLSKRYPGFFDAHTTTRSFMLTLNDVIHPEVRKLFPGAYAPSFDVEDSDERTLSLGYNSHRNMCSFAEGLAEGAGAHYGEHVTITQATCTKLGGDRCVLDMSFEATTSWQTTSARTSKLRSDGSTASAGRARKPKRSPSASRGNSTQRLESLNASTRR